MIQYDMIYDIIWYIC